MSPLRFEAVYERVPQSWDRSAPSAVRFGVRASLGSDPARDAEQAAENARQHAVRSLPSQTPPSSQGFTRPVRGPREAEALPPGPTLLAYSPLGRGIPLLEPATYPSGAGQLMDLRA